MAKMSALLQDGVILNDRYRIIRQIGRGGFGRTYLAEDTQRYREKCVLKEFAPQVDSDRALLKAEELFEREAGILYKLKHEQIPRFEALLRTGIEGKNCLFLVQEYIDGESYWDLLKRGGKFSEKEAIGLLLQLLPVLEYIHQENLIHRDISPDNLIRRNSDDKPVLIDFGCVKIAANAVSQSTGQYLTMIGKKGYAPEEQMRNGQAFPNSDLYSLAVTVLVLLTGQQPERLYDNHQGSWHWRSQAKVSPKLAKILDKMLAYHPRDRYSSAEKVSQHLHSLKSRKLAIPLGQTFASESNSLISSFISSLKTLVVAPGDPKSTNSPTAAVSSPISPVNSNISRLKTQVLTVSHRVIQPFADRNQLPLRRFGLILLGVIFVPGILSFTLINNWFSQSNMFSWGALYNISLAQHEKNRQQKIYQKIKALNLNPSNFYNQVDRIFYSEHPELKGVRLTAKYEHRQYREKWYKIANKLLNERK